MQKTFVKYFSLIMAITVLVTVVGNSLIQTAFAQRTARENGRNIIADIADKIENNDKVIADLIENLDENYIARTKALAEIIAQNPNVIYDFDEMDRIAKVLGVDEVHVTDEKGVLRWGNVRAYYGLDFAATDQTRPFMPGLTDKSFALAQAPQPNGSEGKLFQYISVARQDQIGIVQVGVVPDVLEKALANNKIDSVIKNFNVHRGEHVLAIESSTGRIVADSDDQMIGKRYSEAGIPYECFKLEKDVSWVNSGEQKSFSVFGKYNNYIISVGFDKDILYAERNNQNVVAVISSILLGLIIIIAIFIMLKRRVLNDISSVNNSLSNITCGDLEVVVEAKATPEFAVLSQGINEMVDSLKEHLGEISAQAAELEERNSSILSSLSYARRIQNNLLPNQEEFAEAFSDYSILWEPKDEVGGDVYWIKNFDEGTVLCVCDCTGHGTPGALLTMLVVTALEAIVTSSNCSDPAAIMLELDRKLSSTLSAADSVTDIRDGADMAILFASRGGDIKMSSANTHLFLCNGNTVENIKGQKLFIGEGTLKDKDQIETVIIPADPDSKYYVASDGLFDQIGGTAGIPFGYRRFKQTILENHMRNQEEITQEIWAKFMVYMGDEQRRDDITLISFRR